MRQAADLRLVGRICAAAFLISFLWFHTRTLANWAALIFPGTRPLYVWSMDRENRRNRDVAERLALGTTTSDTIFVWGSNPELYFLAGRSMATPWMDFNVADDYPPRAAESWLRSSTVAELSRSRPRYIVDAHRAARVEDFPEFRSFVERKYRASACSGCTSKIPDEMSGQRMAALTTRLHLVPASTAFQEFQHVP
jgi:hypothetical protein